LDLILLAAAALAASSLGLPFFQLAKRRGRLPGYLLVVALAVALLAVALNTLSPQPSDEFGGLLVSDALGGLFGIVTLSVTLVVAIVSLSLVSNRARSFRSPL